MTPDPLTREDLPEAIVIRIDSPRLLEEQNLLAFRDALFRATEGADRPVVIDLSRVEFLSSAALGWFITVRRKLTAQGRPFEKPCRLGALFPMFADRDAALAAIRAGDSNPLLLCSVSKEIKEIFCVC
jgi:hypothetical protein